jgi:hypothetical protein
LACLRLSVPFFPAFSARPHRRLYRRQLRPGRPPHLAALPRLHSVSRNWLLHCPYQQCCSRPRVRRDFPHSTPACCWLLPLSFPPPAVFLCFTKVRLVFSLPISREFCLFSDVLIVEFKGQFVFHYVYLLVTR